MRYASTVPTPIGALTAIVDEDGALTELRFAQQPAPDGVAWDDGRCAHVRRELDEYFAGERREFTVELRPRGTPWQHTVWRVLRTIPYGASIDYRDLATLAGNRKAYRAAGRANATNPIPILIPCHRVLGADGSLTGYGGGVDVKEHLIFLEGGRRHPSGTIFAARMLYAEDRFGPPELRAVDAPLISPAATGA
jgi:methylated-DNA-[protein]-cysteine S-methyltransferase